MHSGPQSPHPSPDVAREVARRLFAREAGDAPDDPALVRAAEQLPTRVADGLSRWFGPFGSLALVTRALLRAQVAHPALALVRIRGAPAPIFAGWAEAAAAHGAHATATGATGLLEALAEAIGRLIGDDLAMTLIEQSALASASSAMPAANGGTDGTGPLPADSARAPGNAGDDHHEGRGR